MNISKILLTLSALIYFAFGFMFLIIPDIITTMDGIVLPDRPAANHIRAVYGGMEIGLGLLLIYFCIVKDGVRNGLIVLAFSIGATALSRLYGIVFDGGGDMSNVLSFVAEFVFAGLAVILFFLEKRKADDPNRPCPNDGFRQGNNNSSLSGNQRSYQEQK